MELQDRVYSKTNKHTVATKLDTWTQVAIAAGFKDPFSTDIKMIYDVAAVLWKSGYRSIDSYLAVARHEMIMQHGSIPDSLLLHFKRISRAAARGRGPAKQATELPFLRLLEVEDSVTPLAAGGPCHPRRFAIISSWWMLREIEASNLTLGCVQLADNIAHISLPSSKTDTSGQGTTRSLCCTCSSLSPLLCPYHVLQSQVLWISSLSPPSGSSPLFPASHSGDAVATKKAIVQTILNLAQGLNLPLHTLTGAARFTGHSFRVTGAIFLASSGIDVWRIQLHGRWGSDTVLKYVRLAPLGKSLALEASLGRDLTEVRRAILDAKATLASLAPAATTASTDLRSLSTDLDKTLISALGPVLSAPAPFLGAPQLDQILNTNVRGWHRLPDKSELLVANIGPPDYSGKLHALRPPHLGWTGTLPAIADWAADPKAWCSWDFVAAGKRAEFHIWTEEDIDSHSMLCSRCFGNEDLRKHKASSSSSSSSSD